LNLLPDFLRKDRHIDVTTPWRGIDLPTYKGIQMNHSFKAVSIALPLTLAALGACTTLEPMPAPEVPAAIAVPAGNKLVSVLKGEGLLSWECKANAAGAMAWAGPSPDADLSDKGGAKVGKYYGGPTWSHDDGSKVTGKQLAVSPSPGNIPLQLVQANPATGEGLMTGVTYIQRLNTKGGTAAGTCAAENAAARQVVKYSADYYFYKAF
jgi:hypothetical protein